MCSIDFLCSVLSSQIGILQKQLVQNIDEGLGPGNIFGVLEGNMKKC